MTSQLVDKIYPRTGDLETVCLREIISKPGIKVGEYTMYNDFVNDPMEFEKNDMLYQYPINYDRLVIGKFCSVACGMEFISNSANHMLSSLSTYPFPLFFEERGLGKRDVVKAQDSREDIIVGNDVWIGYEAVIMAGVTIENGAVIGARTVVTKDVPPYTIVGGVPVEGIRKRFSEKTVAALFEMKWWDWPRERIVEKVGAIQAGNLEQLR